MTIDQAVALQSQAWQLQEAGKLDDAAAVLREAVRLTNASGQPATLDVANLLNDLAEVEYARGAIQTSLELARQALALLVAAGLDDDTAVRIRLRSIDQSAAAQRSLGSYPGAEAELLEAITVAVGTFGPQSFEATQVRNSLGMVYKYWGRWDDGLRLYGEVLRTVLKTESEWSDAAASVYHNIGGLLHARGDCTAAEEPARRAWDIARAVRGDGDVETMLHAVAYAAVIDGLDRHEESLNIYRSALRVLEQQYGPHHPEVGATLHNLAAALAAVGAHEEAAQAYRGALAIKDRTVGPNAPDTALTRHNLGKLLCEDGQSGDGLPLLESALQTLESRLPSTHPHVIAARKSLTLAR